MKLSQEEFEDAVLSALKKLPKVLKNKMENIDVVVEEEASREILEEMGLRSARRLARSLSGNPIRSERVLLRKRSARQDYPVQELPSSPSAETKRRWRKRLERS